MKRKRVIDFALDPVQASTELDWCWEPPGLNVEVYGRPSAPAEFGAQLRKAEILHFEPIGAAVGTGAAVRCPDGFGCILG